MLQMCNDDGELTKCVPLANFMLLNHGRGKFHSENSWVP